MKTIWFVSLLAITCVQAQNVFLLGSNTALPPDLNGNVQPLATTPVVVATAPVAANVNVNVNLNTGSACAYQTGGNYPAQYYNTYYPQYSPNVMYVGGPGTCGPNYYNYYPYQNSSVIYFGGLQAYREGYHFRHCR